MIRNCTQAVPYEKIPGPYGPGKFCFGGVGRLQADRKGRPYARDQRGPAPREGVSLRKKKYRDTQKSPPLARWGSFCFGEKKLLYWLSAIGTIHFVFAVAGSASSSATVGAILILNITRCIIGVFALTCTFNTISEYAVWTVVSAGTTTIPTGAFVRIIIIIIIITSVGRGRMIVAGRGRNDAVARFADLPLAYAQGALSAGGTRCMIFGTAAPVAATITTFLISLAK
ncbi:MAG: hypothetical protein IKU31_02680 [Oscillospiraceae bacterium]|nr:hypothetical protein [Oscillospiraceae bacterium]